MEQKFNPYTPPETDDFTDSFVPDAADIKAVREETVQFYKSNRPKLLRVGLMFYFGTLTVIPLFFFIPVIAAVFVSMAFLTAVSIFAGIYLFEVVKNGHCSAECWCRHLRNVILYRFAHLFYMLPGVLAALSMWFLYCFFLYGMEDISLRPVYFLFLMMIPMFLGINVNAVTGAFFVMDIGEDFRGAYRNTNILMKASAKDLIYGKSQKRTFLAYLLGTARVGFRFYYYLFYYVIFTLTLGLIWLYPYYFVYQSLLYLKMTETYRKSRLGEGEW
jgi:hypothetical protein